MTYTEKNLREDTISELRALGRDRRSHYVTESARGYVRRITGLELTAGDIWTAGDIETALAALGEEAEDWQTAAARKYAYIDQR